MAGCDGRIASTLPYLQRCGDCCDRCSADPGSPAAGLRARCCSGAAGRAGDPKRLQLAQLQSLHVDFITHWGKGAGGTSGADHAAMPALMKAMVSGAYDGSGGAVSGEAAPAALVLVSRAKQHGHPVESDAGTAAFELHSCGRLASGPFTTDCSVLKSPADVLHEGVGTVVSLAFAW
jgi:hypothetical protein